MPRRATLRLLPLQTCLVNLPLSVYGQLVSRGVTPQSVVVCLAPGNASSRGSDSQHKNTNVAQKLAYVGWSGMPSRVVGGAAAIAAKSNETVEMDPVCALELGLRDGQEVRCNPLRTSRVAVLTRISAGLHRPLAKSSSRCVRQCRARHRRRLGDCGMCSVPRPEEFAQLVFARNCMPSLLSRTFYPRYVQHRLNSSYARG